MNPASHGQVQHINPPTLHSNPAFTNVVVVEGPARTVYVGGQDAVDAAGTIVGRGDLKTQTQQVLINLEAALKAGEAALENIIKWNVYVVQGQDVRPALEVFQRVWGRRPNPPAITVVFVAGLANPEFLVEMDAIAVVP